MLNKSAKAKGRELEKHVAQRIRDHELDTRAKRTSGSGSGLEKGDISTNLMISGLNANIECKNQKVMNFKTWWRQTEKQCMDHAEPLLVFKFEGDPMEAAKCVIYLETLLDTIKRSKEPKTSQGLGKEEKWKVQRLVEAARAVLKIYE